MKIGLIQTQKFGDHVIAMPIAQQFIAEGHQVVWPMSTHYLQAFAEAAPNIHFIPVDNGLLQTDIYRYLYGEPLTLLQAVGCDRIIPLYTETDTGPGPKIPHDQTLISLKFDEYKYAVAGVPFDRKWSLKLQRDPGRERALHAMLGITRSYVLVHEQPSAGQYRFVLPEAWAKEYDIVQMLPLTDNPFDWLHTIEHAAKRVMIDSVFANLTEQLNITGDNYLVVRSVVGLTPVYKNGWKFRWPHHPITA